MAEPGAARTAPDGGSGHETLSVIVPVYDERATVAEAVRRVRQVDLPLELGHRVVPLPPTLPDAPEPAGR